MRCICLSHETALEFWRLWSARNGIALHLFHCRKTMQTDDLPFRIFPSSAVLVDSSSAKRTVVEIIDGALEDGVPEELAELLGACRVVLSETHSSKRSEESGIADSSSGAGKVLHVLGHRKPGVRTADGLTYHHSSATYPKGSFLKITRGVYVCVPELVLPRWHRCFPLARFCHWVMSYAVAILSRPASILCGIRSARRIGWLPSAAICVASKGRRQRRRLRDTFWQSRLRQLRRPWRS